MTHTVSRSIITTNYLLQVNFMADKLFDALHSGQIGRSDQLLLCLHSTGDGPQVTVSIRDAARSHGVPDTNLSRDMAKLKGLAVWTTKGWKLTQIGRERANALLGQVAEPSPAQAPALRLLLPRLAGAMQEFVAEGVACYEAKHYRAAVVLTWVGAVSVLYEHTVASRLADFNAEALRRDAKWRNAKTADDLARMKQHEYLQVLESLSVIGKNVKTELEACLKLRNGCGHPNSLKIAESRCAAHIEVLVLNVFEVFA